ncbi:hypothetical protein XOCgx_4814 [Xanthomonas oryzae pv. oryzicola]|nr:hypothetical protein XOCgx_4814 [Xanthomonas oryzae pv. oryzicola]
MTPPVNTTSSAEPPRNILQRNRKRHQICPKRVQSVTPRRIMPMAASTWSRLE